MEVKIYKFFIASPGDTKEEREICKEVLLEINKNWGEYHKLRFEALNWEDCIYSEFGDSPQNIIDKQILDKYDFFIGIINKKFGTPTDEYSSGTEQEFMNALKAYNEGKCKNIFFYFNVEVGNIYDIDLKQFELVKEFKKNIANKGIYFEYNGKDNFKQVLKNQIEKYTTDNLLSKETTPTLESPSKNNKKDEIVKVLQSRLDIALKAYDSQPILWIEPILTKNSELSKNPHENFKNKIDIHKFIENVKYTFIKSPPEFGATCLSHYLLLESFKKDKKWIYLDNKKIKTHKLNSVVDDELKVFDYEKDELDCIVLDSWNLEEKGSLKKLRTLIDIFPDTPIVVMQTIDENSFIEQFDKDEKEISLERDFEVIHLLALPKNALRKVVCEYNKINHIVDDEILLNRLISDIDSLNIHRTVKNCFTLLKVAETNFDETPINRTYMIEKVLSIIFNKDFYSYYSDEKPDLKDVEFVLGRLAETLLKNNIYYFTKDEFLKYLNKFCEDNLLPVDNKIVFDLLERNHIIINRADAYSFKASFWLFYFAAKRMHIDHEFAEYVFQEKLYTSFPEIIEFYTGIDRNRKDALEHLKEDLVQSIQQVNEKIGLPQEMNPYKHVEWEPNEEEVKAIHEEIGESVIGSKLPIEVKDSYSDKNYDLRKPYNQTINKIFENYSVLKLMQNIKATSVALRNCDYVSPAYRKEIIKDIFEGWHLFTKIILAISPVIALKGNTAYDGIYFNYNNNIDEGFDFRINDLIQKAPHSIVSNFKNELFSSKMTYLLEDYFKNNDNPITKHEVAILVAKERPKNWMPLIKSYIELLPKNSYFLFDILKTLMHIHEYHEIDGSEDTKVVYLIKSITLKHDFGINKPSQGQLNKVKFFKDNNEKK